MKNILCAIMSLLLFVACTSEETQPSVKPNGDASTTPSITLEQNYLNFDEHPDVQTISFSSTMEWTAELINDRADGWCSISATSGSAGSREIDVTVTENTSTDDRTASVIIKSGAISKTVRISQKQRDALTVTASTFEVEGTSGKIYIEVKANVDFEYTINGSAAEWITPIETRAMKTTTLGFNIAENKTMQRREGTITIHSGDLSETVTVYQKDHGDAILLSHNEYVVSDTGEDIAVEVTSNVDVEIEMPDVDWITRNTSRAVSTNTYYFTIAENTSYDQREAYITFKNTEKKITERVKVSQVQKDAIVLANSEYEIEIEGGAIECEILANVDIQVDIPQEAQEWITHVETRALQTNYLVFEVASYDDIDSREALITLSGGDATQTITIRQLTWQNLEDNKIYYTSSDGQIVEPYSATSWGDNTTIISNTYENGQGVIVFSRNLTEIGSWAFQDNGNKFTSITLPKTLKKIGYQAFLSCSQLTEIEIPNSVTSIGIHAFAHCKALTEVTLGENLETIGDTAFIGCTALTSITIPDKVKYIGYESFRSCANLTEVTLGSSLETIGENAFLYCEELESITIPDSVTSIGSSAFQDCYALASVTFGRGLETIGDSAFAVCNSLTNITIPDNVKWLGNNAFNSCENLAKVNIGDGVETIGSEAFRNCEKLAEINLGSGLETIEWGAFANNSSLTRITIPNNVKKIGSSAFYFCDALTSITIPNSVKAIEDSTFNVCSNLAEVNIGEGVETIGEYAFYATALTNITIPNSVKTIEGWAFEGCSNLTEINIGAGVETIGECAFQYCEALTSINIPGNVKTINNYAFAHCYNLAEITLNEGLETIGGSVFENCSALKSLTIPQSVKEITGNPVAYCNGIEAFYGKFASEDNTTLSKDGVIIAIANHESLTEYTIPNGITKIADSAFANWYNLQSITIPDSVTEIGENAFINCGNLQSINIPEGVTTIEMGTFRECGNLKQITFPNNLTKIESWAFEWTGLTEITIPDSVTEIESGAFAGCENLSAFNSKFASADKRSLIINNELIAFAHAGATEYNIPEGVTTIKHSAFIWIISSPMATISLPNSLTTIEAGAFYDCRTISEITIPENVTYIGDFVSMEKLSKIYCKATTPPTLDGNPFDGSQTSTHTIYVPTTSVNAYKNADGWRDYAHLIVGYNF